MGGIRKNTESLVLLGTLATTSGATQTLSNLVLTGYKRLYIAINNVNPGASKTISFGTNVNENEISPSATAAIKGGMSINLENGMAVAQTKVAGGGGTSGTKTTITLTEVTQASTALTFIASGAGAAFSSGEIKVYGVR